MSEFDKQVEWITIMLEDKLKILLEAQHLIEESKRAMNLYEMELSHAIETLAAVKRVASKGGSLSAIREIISEYEDEKKMKAN